MRFTDHNLLVGLMVVAVLVSCNNQTIQCACVLLIVGMLCFSMIRYQSNSFRLHLISSDMVNESLVLDCKLAGRPMLFLIDTGYAGPPVLSASYLSVGEKAKSGGSRDSRFKRATASMEDSLTVDDQNRAIDNFIRRSQCFSYTSGCTMRLMGIGATQEQQADMLMCEMLQIRTTAGFFATPKNNTSNAKADVFVTNPLPSSIHILTCDFLLHSQPAYLNISGEELHLNMGTNEELFLRPKMTMHPMIQSGGSFVVTMTVGGVEMRCTVDTGAPGPICLGMEAARRIKKCSSNKRVLKQLGVNGEEVCSEIVVASVFFGGLTYDQTPVFINNATVEQVDGYVGMGFLRAFNILITDSGIGFAANGMPMTKVETYEKQAHEGGCSGLHIACTNT